jgi:putative FmdB family regulatory protein
MPLYEYQCESCGRRSEVLQKLSDPPLAVCPHCGGALKKLLSAPAFQLKGSGWYATDYAKKPSKGEAAKSEGAASTSDAKSTGTSDSSASPAKESSPAPSSSGSGGAGEAKSSTPAASKSD